jgi:MFS transporter, PPP family, 3-phenylpropionic acid transporter
MKKLWPFSFYFFYFAAIATLLPYLVLYYEELGLSGRQMGFLTALPPLITLVSAPLWTGVADSTHRHRLVLSLSLLSCILAILAVSTVSTYWALLPLVVLFAFAIAPAGPLADTATMTMLVNEKDMYGRVRLGGSFGWCIASVIAGVVIEQTGLHSSFYLFSILMAITLLIGLKLVFPRVITRVSIQHGLHSLLRKPRWVLFLSLAFVGGIGIAAVNTYLFFYMGELGSSKTLMWIGMVVATLSEMPVLYFSNRLIRRFNVFGLLVIGLAATGVRLLLFAMVNMPVGIIFVQLMSGLTFPLIWVAGVTYANEHAPAGMNATAQGLFGSVLMGFGAATGNFLGGFLIDSQGTQFMYMFFGILVLVALFLFTLIERRLPDEAMATP